MRPTNHRPGHGGHRTFLGQVARRVKHKIAVKVVIALLKLAAVFASVAFLGLMLVVILLLLYVAQTF